MQKSVSSSLGDSLRNRDNFTRIDEQDDALFYSRDRLVPHLDSLALDTIVDLIDRLVVEENPKILDLMASWDSHIPARLQSCRVIGLGMNETELKKNRALSDYVVHDLNRDCRIPFPDRSFDVVLNTVSVDYLTNPVEVFREAGRILKPGGLFLVIFSNRMFPEKAVKIWRESSEEERILLVEDFLRESGSFHPTEVFVSKGRPRPSDDKYAYLGTPSDPVYAVYTEKQGKIATVKSRPSTRISRKVKENEDILKAKKREIHKTLQCPYCNEKMKKWAVPENPFEATWENEYLYICFNDNCPYYVRGWDHVYRTTSRIASYRLMYNQEKDICSPIPVPSPKALRESIMD
jgi:SAM-dependent methyltransferase